MSHFNDYLNKIADNLIVKATSQDNDDFECVKNFIVDQLSCINKLYDRATLFGTIAHGTRLYNNDEYDVLLEFRLPHYQNIKLLKNNDNFLKLDVSEVNCDSALVDAKNVIKCQYLRCWLDHYFKSIFGERNSLNVYDFVMSYKLREMRHSVHVKSTNRNFTINFVAAFKIVYDRYPNDNDFCAISKLMPGCKESTSFMVINPAFECSALQTKQVLKKALILLQGMCANKDLGMIKYYHLLHLALSNDIYATVTNSSPLSEAFLLLIAKLCDSFDDKNISYCFGEKINLLSDLDSKTLEIYGNKLNKAFDTLSTYMHQESLSFKRCNCHFN